MAHRHLVALVLLFSVTSCTCGDGGREPGTEKVTRADGEEARGLEPLPEPPKLELPREPAGAPGELVVVAARPMGPVKGDLRPAVTFSRPVKSLAEVEARGAEEAQGPLATITPEVEGEWRWLGSASAEFVPARPLPYATQFKVVVHKGLRAIDGTELKDDYAFEFSSPRPELQDLAPARGNAWLRPDQTFKLLFNQPVRELPAHVLLQVQGEARPRKLRLIKAVSIAEERRAAEQERGGRNYERMERSERGFVNQQTRYELKAEGALPTDRDLTLTIDEALSGAQGPLTLGRRVDVAYRTYGPLTITGAQMCGANYRCPRGPLVLLTSNEVDLASLGPKLSIDPKVEIDWDRASSGPAPDSKGQRVVLPGPFKPGTEYRVEVAAGTRDVFGQTGASAFSGAARTADLEPGIFTGGANALVEAANGPVVPIEVVNIRDFEVDLWNLNASETARVLARLQREGGRLLPRPPDYSEAQTLTYPANEQRIHKVDLSRVFGGVPAGLALIEVNSPNLRSRSATGQRIVAQVTNLATHFKLAPAKSLVWVTQLSTGKPVRDATVVIYDGQGKVRWSGISDANGLADVPGAVELGLTAQYEWETPFAMAVAQKDLDSGVSSSEWSEGISPWEFNLPSGWEGAQPTSDGFVFTDRGLYRPGDSVHLKGIARYRSVGKLLAPAAGSELTLQVRDPRGNELKRATVKTTRYGTFHLELPVPKEAATGWYTVEVSGRAPAGELSYSGNFRVAEYRAPQFKVDVQPRAASLIAGEPLEATVQARYLFGGAMSDAKVRWSAQRVTGAFEPKGLQDFTFEQQTWWWDDNEPAETRGFFGSGVGAVDAKGLFELKAGSVEAPGDRTWTYTLEAEVEDVNRQTVANRASVTVHPAAYYVGLRTPTGFRNAGEEVSVDTVVTDTRGARVAKKPVTVEVVQRTWKSVKQKDASGGYRTLSEPSEQKVHECALQSAEDASVPCAFTAAAPGFYIVRATVTDEKGRRHVSSTGMYLTGPGFVAWKQNDTERIDLVPDKPQYAVGDVAKVLVKSPYPEAQALISVEREGVLERRVVTLSGSVSTVEVPITEGMVPDVFVSALLVRPRLRTGGIEPGNDAGRPAVRVGMARLEVERTSRRLGVSVKPDRAEYRPGQEVKAAVSVRDWKGNGIRSEVTFYAVDEAVLRLTDYKTPDPVQDIFQQRALSVRTGEPLIHLVRRRSYGEKGEEAGGGGAVAERGGAQFRGSFKTTAVFREVETSPNGTATVSFKLPDNLTSFRIMAVAVSADDRFGSGEQSIEVSKPLLALPALPRFARVGDSFEAGVVVHSRGAAQGEVLVTAQAQNAKLTGAAEQRVEVTEGAPREVRFRFEAPAPGTATFRFRVQRGEEQDGVEVKIPIELPVGIEAVATYGDTTTSKVEGISPPRNARSDVGGLEVTLASTGLGNFQEGFRQLVEYPYGCLEQQASRLIPFVSLRELAPKFGLLWSGPQKAQADAQRELNAFMRAYLFEPLDVSGEQDPDTVVRETIRSIAALQAGDGSFRYWPGADCSDSWTSAYATLALFRAKDVGYEVPPQVLSKAQGYLGKVLAAGACQRCETTCDDEIRVMAAYVLARTGKPQASTYPELFHNRDKLPLFSKALLADAIFVGGGNRDQARQLLQELLNQAKESPRGVHFEEVHPETYANAWHSDARTTGAVLQTLTTISPDHPYVSKIAHYLTGARQGGKWRSTQEAAFSLIGLTELVRAKEQETPAFLARVKLGDEVIAQDDFRGRTTAVKALTVPMATLLQKTGGRGRKLSFQKEGPGVLYYSALLRYAPSAVPSRAQERGLFVQRWFEPYAGGGQSHRFNAGDLVRVRVRVSTNQDRHFVAIEVPLPAGLEPVDTSLASAARLPRVPGEEGREVEYDYESDEDQLGGSAAVEERERLGLWADRFWSPFNHVEQRDSKVMLFADHLPPGIHVTSFVARATTPGTFVLTPARGELMYEPEVFGRSDGGKFQIVRPREMSQR